MALAWFSDAADLMSKGEPQAAMNVTQIYSGPFPLVHDALDAAGQPGPRQEVELVAARVFKVSVGTDNYAAVLMCRKGDSGPEWTVYCGDKQVQGTYRSDGKTMAKNLRTAGVVHSSVSNLLESSDWVGRVADMAACGFFRMLERGKYCTHTKAVLANTPKETYSDMQRDLYGWLSGAPLAATASPAASLSAEDAAFYDAAFIQHVMLAGERGSGKTFLARQVADKYDAVYLEMQMHPSMEAWEFRAHDRVWNGKVYTVLGPLAEAAYWIQKGKRVVLCMDEFLNMNPLYTTVINTPLSLTSRDTYLIETGRIIEQEDGLGTKEMVEVPADMFWVVATTNVGANYNLDKIAPSVRARFQIILMNSDPARTKSILEQTLTQYDLPLELAPKFAEFMKRCNQGVKENLLDEEVTTRLACNVIRAVRKKADRDRKSYKTLAQWMPRVRAQLEAEIAQVVNFEYGPLHTDQASRYLGLIKATFV